MKEKFGQDKMKTELEFIVCKDSLKSGYDFLVIFQSKEIKIHLLYEAYKSLLKNVLFDICEPDGLKTYTTPVIVLRRNETRRAKMRRTVRRRRRDTRRRTRRRRDERLQRRKERRRILASVHVRRRQKIRLPSFYEVSYTDILNYISNNM